MDYEELAGQVSYLIKERQLKAAVGVLNEAIDAKDGVVDYERVLQRYHAILPLLPKVSKLTEPRKRAIRARQKGVDNPDLFWASYFARVSRCPFLTRQKPGVAWRATFDWLLNPTNMIKVAEGNYDPPKSSFLSDEDRLAARFSA